MLFRSGPELFRPRTSGTVIPNNQLSGGGGSDSTTLARLEATISLLARKISSMNPGDVVTAAGPGPTMQHVERGFTERMPQSEKVRTLIGKR